MFIDAKEVLRLARLAHLEYPEGEEAGRLLDDDTTRRLRADLEEILEHVRDLSDLELDGVEPTAHGIPVAPLLRADEVDSPLAPEKALAQAPARDGNGFSVPKVIE